MHVVHARRNACKCAGRADWPPDMHKVTEYHVGERRMRLIPRAGLRRTGALIGIALGIARIGLRRRTCNGQLLTAESRQWIPQQIPSSSAALVSLVADLRPSRGLSDASELTKRAARGLGSSSGVASPSWRGNLVNAVRAGCWLRLRRMNRDAWLAPLQKPVREMRLAPSTHPAQPAGQWLCPPRCSKPAVIGSETATSVAS